MFSFFRQFMLVLAALIPAQSEAFAAPSPPMVMAAASLQESLNAAADAWARKNHPRPRISFAASSALARQIESGAPADMFISADEEWMAYLGGKGLLKQKTRVPFLTNGLVLIAPKASKASLKIGRNFPLAKALGPGGRLAVADTAAVPAGRYAKQALTNLGVWNSVKDRLAPGESVRAALAFVSRSACPLGVVYSTDARADPSVRVVGIFLASSHAPIRYPLALLARSRNPEAEGFRRFLLSAEGKAIFRRYGFGTG